jgi:Amt family ammonium transporter
MAPQQYVTVGNTTTFTLSTTTNQNTENLFVLFSSLLVILMLLGFMMYMASMVQAKNRQSIIFKSIANLLATAFAWWSLGYMCFGPYGVSSSTNDSWFMGTERAWGDTPAFLGSVPKTGELLLTWFYGFLMAATSAMIVLGAVAERVSCSGFVFFVICFTGFIWPVVAYWLWNPHGWLANGASGDANPNDPGWIVTQGIETFTGALDFSGSAVVHMAGGCAALVAAVIVGPRAGRFQDGAVNTYPMCSTSLPFFGFGTLLIWLGFFGFNAGAPWSGHGITTDGGSIISLIIVNSVLCPMGAGLAYYLLTLFPGIVPDTTGVNHCLIAALVAVGCGADCMQPYATFVLGITVTPIFIGASMLLKKLQVDDVCEGISMHYFAGLWGMLFLGLFCDPDLPSRPDHKHGWWYGDDGTLFGWQIATILSVTLWVAVMSAVVIFPLNYLGLFRITEQEEADGLDDLYMKYPSVTSTIEEVANSFDPMTTSPCCKQPVAVDDRMCC